MWLTENGLKMHDYNYVHSTDHLRGLSNIKLIKIGTYLKNPEYDFGQIAIMEHLHGRV